MNEWVTTCNGRPDWLHGDDTDADTERWCLVIVWSAAEPARIGEAAFIDEAAGELVLGRGDATAADPSERVHFMRHRPTGSISAPPLLGDGLSRHQCVVQAKPSGVMIRNVGRAELLVDGAPHASGLVLSGQVVHVKDQLSLYCSRQSKPPRLRYFDPRRAEGFGVADEFGIVGEHRVIWELREQIAFAAASDQHVLICGDTGTGKELAARALHQLSRRGNKPLVARNAATFPSDLIDAELFGNAANSPSSGVPERLGLIGLANGTSLFLDEIAELPPSLQAHLLRVLDRGGEYQRLGDPQVRQSDFRLVAATNRDTTELRTDIVGRLTLQIQLPSLVDRKEDIPLLVRHLLRRAAESTPGLRERFFVDTGQGSEPRVHPNLIEMLLRHKYTFNVRELDRLLWKAVADSPRNFVALSRAVRQELDLIPAQKAPITPTSLGMEPSAQDILAHLNQHSGNVAKAADTLGLKSRYALYRLMRKHGIMVERARSAEKAE